MIDKELISSDAGVEFHIDGKPTSLCRTVLTLNPFPKELHGLDTLTTPCERMLPPASQKACRKKQKNTKGQIKNLLNNRFPI